jgi:hypothetical protein
MIRRLQVSNSSFKALAIGVSRTGVDVGTGGRCNVLLSKGGGKADLYECQESFSGIRLALGHTGSTNAPVLVSRGSPDRTARVPKPFILLIF